MNDETFNLQIRKFLKQVGVRSQREIETAVRAALDDGRLGGGESVAARMTLELPGLDTRVTIEGDIALE